jgi:tRNA(adenine34) deaminase
MVFTPCADTAGLVQVVGTQRAATASEHSVAMESHVTFMRRCIDLAELARQTGDFPVGALIVQDSRVISEATEAVRAKFDITAHAETLAIRHACSILKSIDLSGCILYTTAEPCWMCSYAVRQTRIRQVIVGTTVPYVGGVSSKYPLLTDSEINCWPPAPNVSFGILGEECESLRRLTRSLKSEGK